MSTSTTLPDIDLERRIPMSYEEWLTWEGRSQQSEWVDGEAIVVMPASVRHAQIVAFLFLLVALYVRHRRLGTVLSAPVEIRILPRVSREPDLFFVLHEHADRITEQRIEGAVDLAVEVVSPDSVRRDTVAKFAEYARAGVREYWVVDFRPGSESFAAYALDANGTYRPIPLDPDGRLRSTVVSGFWLRTGWLLADPLPDPLACLLEIAPDALAPRLPSDT